MCLTALLRFASPYYSETVLTMPSKEILHERLCRAGFDHFDEKTKLSSYLGSQEKVPLGVVVALDLALYDYAQYIPEVAGLMQMRRDELIGTLLKDTPEALKELTEAGVYKKK